MGRKRFIKLQRTDISSRELNLSPIGGSEFTKKKVAIIHIKGHQAGWSEEAIGNRLADEEARKAALLPEVSKILPLLPVTAPLPEKLSFPPEKLEIIKKKWGREKRK